MAGSGTSLVEAHILGRSAVGLDLDPIARLLCRVKATALDPDELGQACEGLLESVFAGCAAARSLRAGTLTEPDSPPEISGFERWFHPIVADQLAQLKRSIAAAPVRPAVRRFFWAAMSSLIIARTSVANARDLVHSRHQYRPHPTPPDVPVLLRRRLRTMQRMMEDFRGRCATAPGWAAQTTGMSVLAADARQLPLGDDSVDLVFTSPPYCNALDYTRAHTFGVAWLGDVLGIDVPAYVSLGRRYVGSERAPYSRRLGPLPERSPIVRAVIAQVEARDKERGLIVRHYFHDMWVVLCEIARVLRPGHRVVLVVCPSHIRRVDVPTHLAFLELARSVPPVNGYRLAPDMILERRIAERRRVMPYLRDRFGPRMETEYVVVLQKQPRARQAK